MQPIKALAALEILAQSGIRYEKIKVEIGDTDPEVARDMEETAAVAVESLREYLGAVPSRDGEESL